MAFRHQIAKSAPFIDQRQIMVSPWCPLWRPHDIWMAGRMAVPLQPSKGIPRQTRQFINYLKKGENNECTLQEGNG